ncbi:hypothetical protein E5082_29210 [Streptomyces griseoluteus]|uniref:Siderophore-interacting FAD-binding domain-containing protein n=1 Tax=Streptomyces griseoluteus TaxID=29306 RepID=A0A4Z1D0Q7_STRGP|nr:hypothetical protein E5082_29210 [Streptomyces griseoluteus]
MTVTLGGDDVRHLQQTRFDQAGRLFFADPAENGGVFLLSSERWGLHLMLQGGKRRPRVRTYTTGGSGHRKRRSTSRSRSTRSTTPVTHQPRLAGGR